MSGLARVQGQYQRAIRDGMARTLWVMAYADYSGQWHEEFDEAEMEGVDPPEQAGGGEDWNDVAPATPRAALKAADDLVALYEKTEKAPVWTLFVTALYVDRNMVDEYALEGKDLDVAEEFGGDLAMMALGTGVSWFDDHKEKNKKGTAKLTIPRVNFECRYDGERLDWSGGSDDASGPRIEVFEEITDADGEHVEGEEMETWFADVERRAHHGGGDDVDFAVDYLHNNDATETSSTDFHKGIWYIASGTQSPRTGQTRGYSYHPHGFSDADERAIYDGVVGRIGKIVDINRADHSWTSHRYVLAFGAYGDTLLLVHANGLDDALDEAIDWLVEHAPGHIIDDQVNEAYREAIAEGKSEEAAIEIAEQDTTTGGNAGNHINSSEWTIVVEDPTREQLEEIGRR